ncbi:MAG: methyltransferase domain-containing protein [Ilumatobacteraceae bacterium]
MAPRNSLEFWSEQLQNWGIPKAILDQAPQSPWIHPVASFKADGDLAVNTPSRLRALEALYGVKKGSVLDVGCGGGRGAFGLLPPATRLVGVDHQQDMLNAFTDEASERGVECQTVLGDWPSVADITPVCDVSICHNVYYNVAQLEPFARALTAHAKHRVVVELTQNHPLANISEAWRRFWNLTRPVSPDSEDAASAMWELGYIVTYETFEVPIPDALVTDQDVQHLRVRLCLPANRDPEIREYLESRSCQTRKMATIWWDV